MKKSLLSPKHILSNKGYIDPSTIPYIIQAVSGVAIAVGAAVGIHIRRAKKKLAEKMNIDENKNQEVEDDDIIVTDEPSDDSNNETAEAPLTVSEQPEGDR